MIVSLKNMAYLRKYDIIQRIVMIKRKVVTPKDSN